MHSMASDIHPSTTLTLVEMVDPGRAISAAIDLYGSEAATAVAHCAWEAHFAGRRADFHFWFEVFRDLTKGEVD